jgi:hypothetical protein
MSRVLFALVPLSLVCVGCVSKSEAETFDIQEDFERVDIDLPTGAVIVVGHDGDGATVEATSHWQGSRKPDLDVGVEGDALVLRVDCGALSICSVDAQLDLPRGVKLAMDGATGDLTVREFDGDVEASLTTGSITLAEVGGELDLHTTTGDVRGIELGSEEIEIRATTGKVALAFVEAPSHVDVDATTGRIDIELPAGGYAVDAITTTGSVVVEVEQDPESELRVDVRTTTGNIKVHPG